MKEMTYRDALRLGLQESMQSDPTIVILGEEVGCYGGAYGVTKGLLDEFGRDWVRDTPISEEILVGALPLGSLPGAMHMEQEISFKSSGDILVMMSDGLPEAENSEDEMVGYDRTLDTIKSLSDKSAVEIKDGLVELCNNWLGDDAELKDDMTFVIIKKK